MADTQSPAREARAVARFVIVAPSKVRRAADMVRGKPLQEARRILAFSPLRGAALLSKVLESAVANATNNLDLPEDRLFVHRTFVDEGPTYRRFKARAYGRVGRRDKKLSHITVIVRARDEETS